MLRVVGVMLFAVMFMMTAFMSGRYYEIYRHKATPTHVSEPQQEYTHG